MTATASNAAARQLSARLDTHREWLGDAARIENRELEYLRADLGPAGVRADVPNALVILSRVFGVRGELDVCAGHDAGWQGISRALCYQLWSVRLRALAFHQADPLRKVITGQNLTAFVDNCAALLCGALVARDEPLRAEMARILHDAATVPGVVDAQYWDQSTFAPFVLALHEAADGADPVAALAQRDASVYTKLMESWRAGPAELAVLLSSACDYHCARMEEDRGALQSEFRSPPFDLLPLEIFAFAAVRRAAGFETRLPQHPLLALPTAAVQNITPWEDDITRRLKALCARHDVV